MQSRLALSTHEQHCCACNQAGQHAAKLLHQIFTKPITVLSPRCHRQRQAPCTPTSNCCAYSTSGANCCRTPDAQAPVDVHATQSKVQIFCVVAATALFAWGCCIGSDLNCCVVFAVAVLGQSKRPVKCKKTHLDATAGRYGASLALPERLSCPNGDQFE
jgi:hypothetical protein